MRRPYGDRQRRRPPDRDERHGEGPPLVLVHGYVGDRRMWRPQIDELSDELTVVAWDAPGFGDSSDPPEDFALIGLRRLPCRVHRNARAGTAACARALVRWRTRAGAVLAGPDAPADARAGVGVRRAVPLAARRGRRRTSPAGAATGRATAGPIGGGAPSKHVHGLGARRVGRGIRHEHARVSPRRSTRKFARIRGGRPSRRPCPRGCAHTAAVRRQGHARSLECCPRPPRRDFPARGLVFIRGAGHVCNIDAPERFNSEVRAFLRSAPAD